ncbi:hypothetical protein C446_13159 [Halobiforma nitratireducens JCM 10879]|uniref:Uncharacterized protein n=1 Tax=Halobiforma nitratireducens JCM 10879 TaxID=1227454 RepID=M0LST6_9EURY|nr:hypothetical protein C446_13159 [Halobiforma nitratireducens JCM 10879]
MAETTAGRCKSPTYVVSSSHPPVRTVRGRLILPDKTMHTPLALETPSSSATGVETRSGVY